MNPKNGGGVPHLAPREGRVATWTLLLLGIEALVLLVLALSFTLLLATGSPRHVGATLFEIALFLLGSLGLSAAIRTMARGSMFGRSPSIVANIIALPISYSQGQAQNWWICIPLGALALAVLYGLFSSTKSNST